MNFKHLFTFVFSYLLFFYILYNGFQYIFDPDATGYFSVAENVAHGNYFDSINGIWSPLSSWILSPFIKLDFNTITSVKVLNGFYGLCCLISFYFLVAKLEIIRFVGIPIMAAAVFLLLYFAFDRLFGDLLLVLFLLLYLNIICSKKNWKGYTQIILAAFVGGLGFYCKAYTLYFILLHLPVVIVILEKKKNNLYFSIKSIKKILVGLSVLIFICSFWFASLNLKYGHFIVGQNNITGTLFDVFKSNRIVAYPPEKGNYALFDDITPLYSKAISPFTNKKFFLFQTKIIISNIRNLATVFNEFSFFFSSIVLICFFLILKKQNFFLRNTNILLLFSFLLIWPLGFLFFSIQDRFIWIIDLIGLLLAGVLISEFLKTKLLNKNYLSLISLIIIASFYFYPIMHLTENYGTGRREFSIAAALRKQNINGKILTSIQSAKDYTSSVKINYLIHSKFYGPYIRDYSTDELLIAIKQYQIEYYIFYYNFPFQKETFLTGKLAAQSSFVYQDIYPGIVVLSFKK